MRIEAADRMGLEHLLRYSARLPFALEHLHQRDAEHLVYLNPKPVRGSAPGTRPAALVLTPLKLLTKIAALVPPPRAHRHRYFGVLAPNAPLRAVVTALVPAAGPRRRTRYGAFHPASADFCGDLPRAPASRRGLVSVGHAAGAHL